MKNSYSLLCALMLALSSVAQIKVFPGGTTVIGDLNLTGTASKFTVIGNSTFLQSNSPFVSAPFIRGNNGYSNASNPDYTWWGNDVTGIFHPSANTIGFAINGAEKFRIFTNGNLYSSLYNTPGPFADGIINLKNNISLGSRAISIQAQTNGFYQQAVNVDLDRPLSVGYRCIVPGQTLGWYVTGIGWMFSAGSYISSDQSIKTNVGTITNALQTINNLRGVKYNLLGEISNPGLYGGVVSQYYGFIAQETQTAIPGNGVVKAGEDGNLRYISYTSIVPFLVEAMKQQQKQLDSLKQQVSDCCKSNNGNHGGHGNRIINTEENNESNNSTVSYLLQNTPNPFNTETTITFYITEKDANSNLLVFDMTGKLLKTIKLNGSGKGSVIINGNDFKPGMYYYSLIVNNKEIDTKKMILTER